LATLALSIYFAYLAAKGPPVKYSIHP